MRGYFAQIRRAGFDIGLSAGKLTKAMVEVLSQLPPAATPSRGSAPRKKDTDEPSRTR